MKQTCITVLLTVIAIEIGFLHSADINANGKICNKVFILNDDQGNFSSPNYPQKYPKEETCVWNIEGLNSQNITVAFGEIDVEHSKTCVYDFIKVMEKCNGTWSNNLGNVDAYCGKRPANNLTFTTACPLMRVYFKTDDLDEAKGFTATYSIFRTQNAPYIKPVSAVEATATENVALSCFVSGYPPPTIHWTKLNGTLPADHKDLHNGTLEINELKESDTGIYRCNATNPLGNFTRDIYLHVKEKCRCPKHLTMNWYDVKPYIYRNSKGETAGIFRELVEDLVTYCCKNCSRGHGDTEIQWGSPKNKVVDVKNELQDSDSSLMPHFSFPIGGSSESEKYNDLHFVPLVSSPGVAFIVVNEVPGASAMAVFDSVLGAWPVLLLTLVMALLSGIVMWWLDTWYNPEEFPRSFMKGAGEGFWWAFVSMTTVGYGDRSPRGILGRAFGIIWILIGLVITSVFTGVVTTSLTAITLDTDVRLYGTKIGALSNSSEYRLGVVKNAKLVEFEEYEEMQKVLKSRNTIKGVLIDTYVAGAYKELFEDADLRVNKIIDYASHYGIVFSPELFKTNGMEVSMFKKCVYEEYIVEKKQEILNRVESNTKPMEEPKESAAVERSSGLFDSESPLFRNAVYSTLGLFFALAACGIIWDYGYMRHYRKHNELDDFDMIGGQGYEIAKRNMETMDSMMQEVEEFYQAWMKRLDDITERHDEEQKLLSKRRGGN